MQPVKQTAAAAKVRDLQHRIDVMRSRLTAGEPSEHQHQHHQQQAADPLTDQLVLISDRVSGLLTGRDNLTALSARLTSVQDLLLLLPGDPESEERVSEQVLLLQQDVIREECAVYQDIGRLQPLLDSNHLTAAIESVESAVDLSDLTARTEAQAAAADQVRKETDQLMQFYADLMKCTDHLMSEWDKRLKRAEHKK